MKLLDRYVFRNLLEPFFLCFFGFITIWLIFDLSDNGPDFIEAKTPLKHVAWFYLSQVPQIVLLSVPVALLLSLLFALSRMSRHNEIIAMLTAGRSVPRVLYPMFAVGLIATAGCLALNYKVAPHAEAVRKVLHDQLTRKKKSTRVPTLEGHLFKDRMQGRMWFIRQMKLNSSQLVGVDITQQDAEGRIVKKWYAARATYDEKTKSWTLLRGMIKEFNREGDVTLNDEFLTSYRTIEGWGETPWRIQSSQLDSQNLSVPELQDYLQHNRDFPAVQLAPFRTNLADRWAFPWSCFVVVFIASPLGIVFSRRGVLAGVASSIFIFFGMILIRYLFLALGKGARIDPTLAAWLPNVLFLVVGLVLLYFRSTNRDLPKLSFGRRS